MAANKRNRLFTKLLSVWFSKDGDVAVARMEALIAKGQIDEVFMSRGVVKL
jgi:hypothetical protein